MDEQAVEQAFARGKQAWPGVVLELASFRAHLQQALGDSPDWDWTRFGAELFLCCGCARGDETAVRVFESEIMPQVVARISHIDPGAEFLEEVLRQLRAKLFGGSSPRVSRYAARGTLVAWLRVAALRVATDLHESFAEEQAHVKQPPLLSPTNETSDGYVVVGKFETVVRRAIAELSSEERRLLRLQFVGRVTTDQLAMFYGVHRATAARWLALARNRVSAGVRAQLRQQLGPDWQAHLRASSRDVSLRAKVLQEPREDWGHEPDEHAPAISVQGPTSAPVDKSAEDWFAERVLGLSLGDTVPEGIAVFRVGDVIGDRYIIERLLWRGAMAEVYLALDKELKQRVVLKTPAAEVSDGAQYEQRLKREVSLARRVVHANVCRVHDVNVNQFTGEWRAPATYSTMEYLDGQSLCRRVRSGPLGAVEARTLARQVLGALGAIHKAGIVHRDVKTGNIMLCECGAEQKAVVMDFGLAVPMREGVSETDPNGDFVGSAAYASPEQLRGEALTPASDLYSLGVVLFEALAGRVPFDSPAEPLVAAASRSIDELEWPPIEPDLRRLIETCLQPVSTARFQSAHDALQVLEPPAKAPPSKRRVGRPRSRRRSYSPYPAELIDELDGLTVERHRRATRDETISARIRALVAEASYYSSPQVGDLVLGAKLIELVGTGAFGDVWRAKASDGGEVAIKAFLTGKLGLNLALHQFRRGVRAMQQLDSAPGRPDSVVRLLDAEAAQTVFSMPFADKLDLSHALQGWPLERKLEVFRDVCRAVLFAHHTGVVHRDIKPGNILITHDRRPMLADFDSCDFVHIRTLSAQPGGTLHFAAPEQLDGSFTKDLRSDIYSLGRLLHYLLLERDPPLWIEKEPVLEDLQHQPPALVQLIRRCTMRDLNRRWPTVEALLNELDEYMTPPVTPVAEQPASVAEGSVRRVFISYVRADALRVKALVARFEAAGIPTWLDELQLEVGQRWQAKIRAAITSAPLFVALFSRDGQAQERSYMREELLLATDELRRRPRDRPWFIPVALDDVPVPDLAIGAGERLEDIQAARLFETGEVGTQRLIEELRKCLI